MREPASGDVHDVIGQRADEIDIVADESEGALELVEGVGQRVNARQIQMGGRLIHQQQVGWIQQQLHQSQTAFFTPAQDVDFLEHVIAAKQEAAQQCADELLGNPLRSLKGFFKYGALGIEHLGAIL